MIKPVIYGDWGTSSCRLYLCIDDDIVDSATAPGIKFVDSVQGAFDEAIAPWREKYGQLTAILCGMVGANIGWKDAGYVACPTGVEGFGKKLIKVTTEGCDVLIVPGVKTSSGFSFTADIMRGEETQIFGWLHTHNAEGLLCLPGTHTKWVKVRDNTIENFMTSVNGELFDIILKHSVLVGGSNLPPACIGDEYRHGVDAGASNVPLTQLLMSVRSNQILDNYDAIQAKSYLLGMLIGSDVAAALKHSDSKPVAVIGGAAPASFYAEAIDRLGSAVNIFGGQEASLTGLRHILKDHEKNT